jgi:predicted transcriptional regulator
MRTTLTLDDDVDKLLREVAERRGLSFKQVVNDALRAGVAQLERQPSRRRKHWTQPVSLGRPVLPNLDNVADVLALGEGDDWR